jgi:hypothetical protein
MFEQALQVGGKTDALARDPVWRRAHRRFVIMRGIPGSGKSHEAEGLFAEAIAQGRTAVICSTDRYFMVPDQNGVLTYQFDPDRIEEYHGRNQQAALDAVLNGVNLIIIDNTNTHSEMMRPYVEMACYGKYWIEFREPTSPWWLAARPKFGLCRESAELAPLAAVFHERNSHGVALDALVKMLSRWENEDQFDNDIKDLVARSRI